MTAECTFDGRLSFNIIPYQELLGNYDWGGVMAGAHSIIPYQELLGNYDDLTRLEVTLGIIPYQELLGNYDLSGVLFYPRRLYHTKSY